MTAKDRPTAGTVVDLFSGCGGFSLGAELVGFHSLAAIDIDSTLQSAYRRNFPGSLAIEASVTDLDASAWRQLIGRTRPDGVIGGPPCQGFSWIGRRRKRDPRNSLLAHFYKQVAILRPKFFIMENVEGLLDNDHIGFLMSALENVPHRYRVLEPLIVNAAHFGAATSRRRVVVIGYDPFEVDPLSVDLLEPKRPKRLATVRDAISDLPSPIADSKDTFNFQWAKYPARAQEHLSDYARRLRKPPTNGLGWREAIDRHKEGFISGAVSTDHSKSIARRYATIAGGQPDPISKSYKLEWNGQCPTLRAGTSLDKGAFQAVRPLHPGKGRVITVREGARLQGFPDWFVFHPTKWHSFRMIGNSISPAVSFGLLRRIAPRLLASLA
jgi:DNA (cytosine-5)-methyltransferase 1